MERYILNNNENPWEELGKWLEQQANIQAEYAEKEGNRDFRLVHIGLMIGFDRCKNYCTKYTSDLPQKLTLEAKMFKRETLCQRIGHFNEEDSLIIAKWANMIIEEIIGACQIYGK